MLKFALVLIFLSLAANAEQPNTLVVKKEPFSREVMENNPYSAQTHSYGLLHPSRFSMQQSYSTSMSYGGGGMASSGVYLNSLSYQLAEPLTLSMDIGLHTPFYSSGIYSNMYRGDNMENFGSFILPRISLEYKPTENSSISLHYFNLQDAYKAYGPFGHWSSYSR